MMTRSPLALSAALLLALPCVARAQDAAPEAVAPGTPWTQAAPAVDAKLRQRFSLGAYGEQSLVNGWGGVDIVLDERLRAPIQIGSTDVEFRFTGRFGGGINEESSLSHTRVREVALALKPADWELELGRFTPVGGGYHLVDGAQALRKLGGGWRLGLWGGTAPDPYTTLPAGRFGGGPVATLERDRLWVELGSELLMASGGVDRAAIIGAVRGDPSRSLELGARADMEVADFSGKLRPSELQATARWHLSDATSLDLYYDAYSSQVYLLTADRDPALTHYASRWAGLEQGWIARDVDDTVYHAVGGGLDHHIDLGEAWADTLLVGVRGRARTSVGGPTGGSYVRLFAGLPDAMDGRVDLRLEQQVLSWGGALDLETIGSLWFDALPSKGLSVDSSVQVGWRRFDPNGKIAPSTWADVYVDWMANRRFQFAAGYRFGNSLDLYEWDTSQAMMARVTWRESR